jgi:hypothetical protein
MICKKARYGFCAKHHCADEQESNGGAMFCQQTKSRAGAQTKLSDGEILVEGDISRLLAL